MFNFMSNAVKWNLLSNHANVLVMLSREPKQPLREVAKAVGITERAVQRIVADLEEAGYLSRARKGRQNEYTIHKGIQIRHAFLSDCTIGQLLELLSPKVESEVDEERLLGSWTVGEHGSEIK